MGNLKELFFVFFLEMTKILGEYQPRFHVPYACSVLYDLGPGNAALIGAGSILDINVVIMSVDNLNQRIPGSREYFYQHVTQISVHAGTNYMDPRKSGTPSKAFADQSRKAKNLYVAYRPFFSDPTNVFWKNPTNLSREYGKVEYDAFGVSFDVGFLEVEKFEWSAYVRPIIIRSNTPDEMASWVLEQLKRDETVTMAIQRCFTYSYNAALNKMRYHEVTYVAKNDCIDIYCMYRMSKCTLFPRHEHLMCYKSTKYVDVCPEARGAALYCDHFHQSVIGILTFAPLCGRHNTPGVYTSLPLVLKFYQKVFQPEKEMLPQLTKYSLEDTAKNQ